MSCQFAVSRKHIGQDQLDMQVFKIIFRGIYRTCPLKGVFFQKLFLNLFAVGYADINRISAEIFLYLLKVLESGIVFGLSVLGHDVEDIDFKSLGVCHRLFDSVDQEIRYNACIKASGP